MYKVLTILLNGEKEQQHDVFSSKSPILNICVVPIGLTQGQLDRAVIVKSQNLAFLDFFSTLKNHLER